ncbi:MAG: hypothetical protein HYZ37_08965 [Candidatus Solibacter usitatus]|nr:hypothetical protein [Candidatus Solibacter usitatus]
MHRFLRSSHPLSWWMDGVLVFVLAACLIAPIFKLDYSDKWASIESTFIADARFLKDHWPAPRWQPLWYTGTRFDYIYPPALRYGTAGLAKAMNVGTARAYHIYVGFFYALGIAGVYVLARTLGGSRGFALVAALLVATVSPGFLVFPEIHRDAKGSWSEPQRLGVLARYGEGPHMSALAVLGFAIAFSLRALRQGSYGWIAAAAFACALAVSNNFYGATALAMLFPIVLWACYVTSSDKRVFKRAAAIVALSYGLTAFWLVPSYFAITVDNMRFVSERGNRWSMWVTVLLLIVYLKVSERWARNRPHLQTPVFLLGAVALLTLNVVGNRFFEFRVIGEPFRMIPEWDMFVLLAAAEGLRMLWGRSPDLRGGLQTASAEAGRDLEIPPQVWRPAPHSTSEFRSTLFKRIAIVIVLLIALRGVRRYIGGGWKIFVPGGKVEDRIEFQVTDWLAKNMPDARVYTNGTIRFWFNAWYDLAELGGGSEQGLLNPTPQPATWILGMSEDAQYSIAWLICTGVDAAFVADKTSAEHYKDVSHPQKFVNVLPVAFDDRKGNRIYKVPRRYPGLARVVSTKDLDALPPFPEDPGAWLLYQLADVLEKGPDAPASTRWEGTERLWIHAPIAAGQTLFVQVAYDPAWRAYSGAQPLTVTKSRLGFMRIDAQPGNHDVRLEFETPLENHVGRVVFAGSAGLFLWMGFRRRRIL